MRCSQKCEYFFLQKQQHQISAFHFRCFSLNVSLCCSMRLQVLSTSPRSTPSTTSLRHPSSPPHWVTVPPQLDTPPSCCAQFADPQRSDRRLPGKSYYLFFVPGSGLLLLEGWQSCNYSYYQFHLNWGASIRNCICVFYTEPSEVLISLL